MDNDRLLRVVDAVDGAGVGVVAVGVVEHRRGRRDAERRRGDAISGAVPRQTLLLHQLTDDGLHRLRRLQIQR